MAAHFIAGLMICQRSGVDRGFAVSVKQRHVSGHRGHLASFDEYDWIVKCFLLSAFTPQACGR
ncbi:MAG TPA: hypothetical protein VNY35_00845 [Solirubrobacteraceae bacterium]|jgi:hypothetical protein|nr:hypothetical protein [Solirubrobacteraceae bacterium]